MGINSADKKNIDYKISVIIPTYNREDTIIRCINSILCQTYPVFEIIVVDDGSIDRTVDRINEKYGNNRIIIIRQNHKGAQIARNTGIKAARGEYIAFLDSDDEWMPDKIELQVDALKSNSNAVVCGNGYIQTDWRNGVPDAYKFSRYKVGMRKLLRLRGMSGFVYKDILQNSFCLFQALLTSKSNLLEMGLLDEKVPSFQEWDTAIKLAQVNEFIFINKPLFVYHLHDGETISKDMKKDIDGREYIFEKYKYEIISNLGHQELTTRYKQLMKKCALCKDRRMFKYFVKYVLGKHCIFIFR